VLQQEVEGSTKTIDGDINDGDISDGDIPFCYFLETAKELAATSKSDDTDYESLLLKSKRLFAKKKRQALQQQVEGAYESNEESDGDTLLCDLKDNDGTPVQKSKVGLVTMQDFKIHEESCDDDDDDDDEDDDEDDDDDDDDDYGQKNTKVTNDNVSARYLKVGKVKDQKLGKENKKKVKRNTRCKKRNKPDNLWGKLRSSNGDPNSKKVNKRKPKYVVDVKFQKNAAKEREFIRRIHDHTRPMPHASYWPWSKKK
jgi:hypothetical protein